MKETKEKIFQIDLNMTARNEKTHTIEERIKVREDNMEKYMTFTKQKEKSKEDHVTFLSLNKINGNMKLILNIFFRTHQKKK